MESIVHGKSRFDLCLSANFIILKAMVDVKIIGEDLKLTEAIIKLNEAFHLVIAYAENK